MNLSVNLGCWNSIFAIPCDVVDKHIKLAGAVQLKVLLFMLRHAGQNISVNKIAKALAMDELDVKDSMRYWVETKVISEPEYKDKKEGNDVAGAQNDESEEAEKASNIAVKRAPLRAQRPDSAFVARRINESSEISFLMQEAQVILSRPISGGDSATLLMLHESDGLPVDVILMIMQYAVSVGKCNMRYIEKMAISWAQEEIDTVEKAEKKIIVLENYRRAWTLLEKIIGIEHRSPSAKEDEAANRWINEWKISDELLKEAYDRCINAKGRYILSYMDGIIKRWHGAGVKTMSQVFEEDRQKKSSGHGALKKSNDVTSYNIDEYERNYMYI